MLGRFLRRNHLFRPKRRYDLDELPVALFYDNFTAANETNLNNRVPPVRANANVWNVTQGSYVINNNKVEARFPSSGQAVATIDTGVSDIDVTTVVTIPSTGTGRVGGFSFRYTSNADRWSAVIAFDNGELRIIETTGGTSTVRASQAFSFQANTPYSLRLQVQGDVITLTATGVGTINYSSAVGNTRTRHGFRANNTVGAGVIIFDDFNLQEALPLSDVVATISGTPLRTATTHMSMTIVDNNLRTDFAGASTQKNLALDNLSGKYHNLNMFIESFGNPQTLSGWNGTGSMPQPNLTSWKNHFDILDTRINPDTWGVFAHRLPWPFTGVTTDEGATTPSTSSNYNQENRRLLTDRKDDYIEWVARWSSDLMQYSSKIRTFYLGSEAKGFQSVIKVVVNGVTIRADRNQSWDYDDYEGTPGRADMGQFAYALAFREGIIQGAQRASVPLSEVTIVTPYPVTSHQGSLADGGNADAVRTDSRNDSTGSLVDTSDINGDTVYPGWPNVAAVQLMFEHVRLMEEHAIDVTAPVWDFGNDYGTFNEDNEPYNVMNDHDIAYLRVAGMESFHDKVLQKYNFPISGAGRIKKRQPEHYAKAGNPMDVLGEYFVQEDLRDDYQASIQANWLISCYEKGVDYPDKWSPFGRGDQSYLGGSDENQWYGGAVVRTVTNDNNHSGSAVTGGGAEQASLSMIADFKTHFPPGTEIYQVSFTNSSWRGIASSTKAIIVNPTGQTKTVSIGAGTLPVSFGPYERKVIDR